MKTKYKIFIAKIIYILFKIFIRKENLKINRNNINWNVNISEAIDLHLFLFGSFEKEISETAKKLNLYKENCILDIGANSGVQTLQFAKNFPNSSIYAIEPTNFAYNKMIVNLNLNPNLKNNIFPSQLFITTETTKPNEIYSSWSLNDEIEAHKKHKGIKKSTSSSNIISLDNFLIKKKINHLDFIKLDVDGFEFDVLQSGKNFLKKNRPPIFMELAPYLYKEHGYSLEELTNYILYLEYTFYKLDDLKKINDIEVYSKSIKDGSSKNILLM